MRKATKEFVFAISLFIAVSLAFFGEGAMAAGWGNWTTVNKLNPYNNGHVYVTLADTTNSEGCSISTVFDLEPGNSGFGEIYSALLAGLVSGGMEVRAYFSGCATGGHTKMLFIEARPPQKKCLA